jgi:hypothetical protein
MTSGTRMMPATGAMSRMKLKLSFSWRVALVAFAALTRRSVYPSGGARTTASVAILVAAPGAQKSSFNRAIFSVSCSRIANGVTKPALIPSPASVST